MNSNFTYLRTGIFMLLLCTGSMVDFSGNRLYGQQKVSISDKGNVVKKINALYHAGKLQDGKQLTEINLQKSPKDSDLKMLLGKYYVMTKQYDKARFELNKSLEFNPENVDSRHLLVTVETETKRYSSAICYVNELLEVNPYWKGLWRKKIELYRLQGNEVEANRLLKRISQIFPEDGQIQEDLNYQMELTANNKRKSGRIDDAIEVNKLLMQEKPRNIEVYMDLINSYIKAGDYNSAMVTTERGLNTFPSNAALRQKKIALLEQNRRYDEILAFIKNDPSAINGGQYNYFLLEAARSAKQNDPAVLYGKILDATPGNEEAFQVVFNSLVAQQQYDEALRRLHSFMRIKGNSKTLAAKELELYRLKNDHSKVNQLTKTMFLNYPNDSDLKEGFVKVISEEIKDHLAAEEWNLAETKLRQLIPHANAEYRDFINNSLQNAYYQQGKFTEALQIIEEMHRVNPSDANLAVKKASIYMRLQQYDKAVASYEALLGSLKPDQQFYYLTGFNDMMAQVVKESTEAQRYRDAMNWVTRWLAVAPKNHQALLYAVNLSHQLQDKAQMLAFAKRANEAYPEESLFKVRLASAMQLNGAPTKDIWEMMGQEIIRNPYHNEVVNAYVQASQDHATQLLSEKAEKEVLEVTDKALRYQPTNKELKYLKGLAYEKLKQYDSAYYYQSFYEPSLLELDEFKANLKYLNYRMYQNEFAISHMRSRYGDYYSIQTISALEYMRKGAKNNYTARVFYSGREEGKGVQGQLEWGRNWNSNWASRIDVSGANKYFSKFAVHGAVIRTLPKDWEIELGLGHRKLYNDEKMSSAVVGFGKDIKQFRLQAKFTQAVLQEKWVYNIAAQARYSFDNPKNYVVALANLGSTPDVDILDYQSFNTLSVMNSMVGTGLGRLITKNVSASVMGTWYNFQTSPNPVQYRNLYNLFLQANVAF